MTEDIVMEINTSPAFNTNFSNQVTDDDDDGDDGGAELARIVFVFTYPVIIIFGSIGNILTFIVMRRDSMMEVSTCFYMRILALVDTGKLLDFLFFLKNYRTHIHS